MIDLSLLLALAGLLVFSAMTLFIGFLAAFLFAELVLALSRAIDASIWWLIGLVKEWPALFHW